MNLSKLKGGRGVSWLKWKAESGLGLLLRECGKSMVMVGMGDERLWVCCVWRMEAKRVDGDE